jgi:hypothetical protein
MFMATSFFGICFLGFVFGDSLPLLTFSEIFCGDVTVKWFTRLKAEEILPTIFRL